MFLLNLLILLTGLTTNRMDFAHALAVVEEAVLMVLVVEAVVEEIMGMEDRPTSTLMTVEAGRRSMEVHGDFPSLIA